MQDKGMLQLSVWVSLMMLSAIGVAAEDGMRTQVNAVSASPESASTPPPATPPVTEPVKPLSPEDEARAKLDGTSWALEVTPLSGTGKVKEHKDTVSFTARQVTSEKLSKAGYPSSNYSITIGDDDIAVWETMQTKEETGVVFWRGELRGSTMQGVLSKHPTEGAAEDFSFVGREVAGKAVEAGDQITGPTNLPTPLQPPSPSAQEESPKKKKRRGLFGR